VTCSMCGPGEKVELAAKIIDRGAVGITRCHRLACGHAWHVTIPPGDPRPASALDAGPASCTCSEIATVNRLLVEGRQHEQLGEGLSPETFALWLRRVLEALDGIPAESGAPSLARSAATAGKSPTSSLSKKTTNLNTLLGRAIKAVS